MAKKYIDADKLWNRLISVSENEWVGFDTIDEVLSGMPAADVVEVRHGRWIYIGNGHYKCSVCNHMWSNDDYQFSVPDDFEYCPTCGSQMDEVAQDVDL